ncbi:methylated-DNA--[protein]-cysteine S-methyltransferase [Virgibacillus kekensis]|uniref:Methylated-DNA--protein-cysteine methyltransferase n=1 Tax=Virgibacillus kekensis TaxID=202261 RepID=A0ABV9DL90_9BACI
MKLYYDEMETPVGILLLVSDGEKIVRIEYGSLADVEEKMMRWSNRYFDSPEFIRDASHVEHAKQELNEYFTGERKQFTFDFSFYGTPFQQEVWQALFTAIEYGETKTYKDVAEAIGRPKAVRAVGGAVNKNPFSIVVPCHRVVGTNGSLTGYNGGLDKKEYLLKHEVK